MNEPTKRFCRRERIGRITVGTVFVIVGIAGLLKCLDLPVFQDTVDTWTLLSTWTKWLIVISLPPLEMILAVLWLGGIERSRLQGVMLALLAGFGLAYTAHLTLTEPPKCGCFGLVDEYFKGLSAGRMALWRDCALIAALGAGIWMTRASRGAMQRSAGGEDHHLQARQRHELGHAT